MKKCITFLLVLFYIPVIGQTLKIEAEKINTVPFEADEYIGKDQFGYHYSIKNKVLLKTKTNESFEYKNFSLGKTTKIDLQNPLRIVLFYENFNTIILLDNQLNETKRINFSENSVPIAVTATGIASQNQLWIYNNLNQQIGLYDYLKNDYKTISTPLQENFKYYYSDFNTFQWVDSKSNWYKIDIFGKITAIGKVSNFEQIQLLPNNMALILKDEKIILQDLKKDIIYSIVNINKSFKYFQYKDQILSIFTSEEITNYKITIP
ncbi:hypothetical protein [Flavobacterium sp. K5-23]|uniref:hypothetical protein n=1 Tax=Flavobacterium sp. K5-23 TaxID=2746225 RepID=UPI00200C5926|nr:hypothetical protein [Flavobacterium sp. K5-23]UQD55941.1 hypothetical protein FLAK523_05810 [Flavobacterium sp. K5-23]